MSKAVKSQLVYLLRFAPVRVLTNRNYPEVISSWFVRTRTKAMWGTKAINDKLTKQKLKTF